MNTFAQIEHFNKSIATLLLILSFFCVSHSSFAQCSSVPQTEAVFNGDFEQGYVSGSFDSDQMYVYDPANSAQSTLMDAVIADPSETCGCNHACAWGSDGRYDIASYLGTFKCDGGSYDGHPFLTEADGRYDHTKGIGGNGKFMWVDTKASGGSTSYGVKLWEQTVNIYENQNYFFSSWFINLTPASTGTARAELRFIVQPYDASNNPIGSPVELGASTFTPAETSRQNSWEQFYSTYTSPIGAVTAKLGIYNQSSSILTGNDVGIDDISFINGCQSVLSFNSPPAPDLPSTANLCTSNGTMTLDPGVATNAGGGRTFTWYSGTSNPQTVIVNSSTTQNTLDITTPGTYRVCVYEPAGCSKSSTIVVTESNTVSLGPDTTLCKPNSSTVTLTSSLGTASAFYTYSWTKDGAAFPGTSSTNTASATGTYVIKATHTSIPACNATDTEVVTNTNTMTTSLGSNQDLCNSSTVTLTSSLTGSAFTYQWLKNGTVISGATSSSYVASSTGTYTVNLIHPVTGCNVTASVNITSSNTMTPGNNTFCAGGTANLSVTPNGSCPYKWYTTSTGTTPIAGTTGSCTYNPSPGATTTYYVDDTTATAYTGVGWTGSLPTAEWTWTNISNQGLTFNTNKVVIITSVDIWVQSWASISNIYVSVLDGSSNVLGTSSAISYNNATASIVRVTVPLNITVPIGSNNKIIVDASSTSGTLTYNGSFTGPYTSPGGGLTITGSTNGSRYNYFTDWKIQEKANSCARLAVTASLENPCVTPVEFLLFSVVKKSTSVGLHWATALEENSNYFVVERSSDGVNFQEIGKVEAAGNSSSVLNYYFTDYNPSAGMNFYRIKEADIDGRLLVTDIKEIDNDGRFVFTIFPNPGRGLYTINLANIKTETQVTVYDIAGREVFQKVLVCGNNPILQIDIQAYPSSVYYVEVKSDEGVSTQKLIKE